MLQNGYSVLREACIGWHLDVVRMLVENYKCNLRHVWAHSAETMDFHRLFPEGKHTYQEKFCNNREVLERYLNKTFGSDETPLK